MTRSFKSLRFVPIAVLFLFFIGCARMEYIQVFETKSENSIRQDGKIVFQDSLCRIEYDLWSEGGLLGFNVHNKTDDYLYIHLDKTFFTLNGRSFPYFQNRYFSNSSSSGIGFSTKYSGAKPSLNGTTSAQSSYGVSITRGESPMIVLPPKTYSSIAEYGVRGLRYVDCGLPKNPGSNSLKSIDYSKGNTPFEFSNLITLSNSKDTVVIKNEFYVSRIFNIKKSKLEERIDSSECGTPYAVPKYRMRKLGPSFFYITYTSD